MIDEQFKAELEQAAEAMAALSEEVEKRARAMLGLAGRLEDRAVRLGLIASGLTQSTGPGAADSANGRSPSEDGERPLVGRRGAVRLNDSLESAKALTKAHAEGWRRADLQETTGLNPQQAGRHLAQMLEMGSVTRVVQDGVPTSRFLYVEITAKGPTRRPDHAASVDSMAGVGADATRRGEEVPHVRPVGGTGKPGADKKLQAKGYRVRRRAKSER